MIAAAAGRLGGRLVAVLAALMLATFLLVHLVPGDPARRVAGLDATPEDVARVRTSLGLDLPLPTQFLRYVGGLGRLDLGRSFVTGEPVAKVIADRLPRTAELAGAAVLLVLAVSLPLGMLTAAATQGERNRWVELGFIGVTAACGALPNFLTATFLAFLFAVWLGWLPVAGAQGWSAVILPAAAVGLRPLAELARIIRIETLSVLAQDYIRTARAKRLSSLAIYLRHVLPNVLTAALTLGGLLFAGLIGGTVIVENVFAWPGLGTALVQAVLTRDYPVIQGGTLLLGCTVVVINAGVDLLLMLVDPRAVRR